MNINLPLSTTIETERLLLTCPSLDDIPFIFEASRHPGFNDGMLWDPPVSKKEMIQAFNISIEAWNNGLGYAFTIKDKMTNSFIGRISTRKQAEEGLWNIGFFTVPEFQGHGYMKEATRAIITLGFEKLKAKNQEACYALWNKASEKVLISNGMKFKRYIPKGFQKTGYWVEEFLLGISREDWGSEVNH